MGSKNPIVECREMLQSTSFIVIDGLQSTEEWDIIKDELVSRSNPLKGLESGPNSKNVIIVTTTDERIATHCRGPKEPLTYNVKAVELEAAVQLFKKVCVFSRNKFPVFCYLYLVSFIYLFPCT
jgi:hypothetical protein